jgi:hypothetical protein
MNALFKYTAVAERSGASTTLTPCSNTLPWQKEAVSLPCSLLADVGVRPTWHPAFDALQHARHDEQEAKELAARSERVTPMSAIRHAAGSVTHGLAFWKHDHGGGAQDSKNDSNGRGKGVTTDPGSAPPSKDQRVAPPSYPLPLGSFTGVLVRVCACVCMCMCVYVCVLSQPFRGSHKSCVCCYN